jgi:hypothetical protein
LIPIRNLRLGQHIPATTLYAPLLNGAQRIVRCSDRALAARGTRSARCTGRSRRAETERRTETRGKSRKTRIGACTRSGSAAVESKACRRAADAAYTGTRARTVSAAAESKASGRAADTAYTGTRSGSSTAAACSGARAAAGTARATAKPATELRRGRNGNEHRRHRDRGSGQHSIFQTRFECWHRCLLPILISHVEGKRERSTTVHCDARECLTVNQGMQSKSSCKELGAEPELEMKMEPRI